MLGQLPVQCLGAATGGDGFASTQARIALEHLEAHAHLVDAVVQGFQFGGFIHHVFRRSDLAAVVQPRGDMQFFPLIFAEFEVAERPALLSTGGPCEHLGQFRHTLAVAAGIRALGVDGAGDQLDK